MKDDILKSDKKCNATIDIVKLLFALFVVGIHTDVFGFSFWLDKSFGVATRLCVPFFFVTSSYFFFRKDAQPFHYIKRLCGLYLVWCVLYVPLNFSDIKEKAWPQLLLSYLWSGHDVLWYLLASVIGFIIAYAVSRWVSPKITLMIGALLLLVGCIKSTYTPLLESVLGIEVPDFLGVRNGLYYGFPYYALGLFIAKNESKHTPAKASSMMAFAVCFVLLAIESVLFTIVFKTEHTTLWLSVLPLTYFLFATLKWVNIPLPHKWSLVIRKTSTLVYVIHPFFRKAFNHYQHLTYFLLVSIASVVVSLLLIFLSERRRLTWLRVLF